MRKGAFNIFTLTSIKESFSSNTRYFLYLPLNLYFFYNIFMFNCALAVHEEAWFNSLLVRVYSI